MHGWQVMHAFSFHYPKFVFHINTMHNTQITRDFGMHSLFTSGVQCSSLMGNACISLVFSVSCGVCVMDYTFGIVASSLKQCASLVHHIYIPVSILVWITLDLSFCEYCDVCCDNISLEWRNRTAHITCEPYKHLDVYRSLSIKWNLYRGIYTWEYTLEIVDSKSVHHLWTTFASWCQW